ncbi:hypothetical protein ACJIZ3_002751 [Penstemon smallii]|uniref:HTH La-type RNA-binding domain-containing protein n=1 Tax=Penstemon smallii TaxID=265156 RepID=A0ABD3U9W2_9LAMI
MADSPRSPSSTANGGVSSPPSRRRNLTSPWASVVRGDSEQISSPAATPLSPPPEEVSPLDNFVIESLGSEAQPESSDDSNAGRARRPAWNRPVNGIVDGGSIMGGAVVWPALSESTRPIPRSLADSSRPVSDGSAASSQVPIISQPPQRQANTSAHANSTANNTMSPRPRSRNRGGGGGGGSSSGTGPSQNTFNRPSAPTPPVFPVFEVPYGMVPPMLDPPMRGSRPVGGLGGSQSHTGNDHSSQRNTSRRGHFGPRPRGDGPYNNNHGGRRDQDRRDVHVPPQYVLPPMGYMPSHLPPGAGPFMAPPPPRVLPGQMGFDMASPFIYVPAMLPDPFRAMPIVSPPPPMPFPPANEDPLTNMIVNQIDYYFSDDNLVKDSYLRSHMDDNGWVPISLIASFRRVQQLTTDIPMILEALRYSAIVEVQGDKVRRRNEWSRWLHSSTRLENGSTSHTPVNVLTTSLQEVSLDSSSTNANGNIALVPEESSRLPNGEDRTEEARSITA